MQPTWSKQAGTLNVGESHYLAENEAPEASESFDRADRERQGMREN
jgi:hypothetical protein